MTERLITVCSACRCASCWHGKFRCDQFRNATTLQLPISTLAAEDREHPDNWEICDDCQTACCGQCAINRAPPNPNLFF